MTDLTPRTPTRPLLWPDLLLDLADWLLDQDDSVPVHIVGGAVRDAYLGYPLKDIDLVAASGAVRLARRLADAFNGDVFVMDAEREVARVLIETP
ncbi:MAG: CCA tRNA nucleotidyltransferase, partial [Anaerolineae bacterium]|nr:CCA tRNA nucleotidyltransferase [Anaerolineae bacterium]